MDTFSDLFSGALGSSASYGVPMWVMVALGIVMFGAWLLTYITIIIKCKRDRAYGIPFPNTCLNASWELIFAFDLAGGLPPFAFPLRLGHLVWLVPDAFVIFQTVKYGPSMYTLAFMKKYFRAVFAFTFAAAFLMLYTYHFYSRDVYGVASSWIINVFMSWLFIRMLLSRLQKVMPDGTIQGMSVKAAWFKLIGNAAGVAFCFFWWPAQFGTTGKFLHNGIPVYEPISYVFLYILYAINITLDIALIVMLRRREAEIRGTRPAAAYQLA